MTPNISEYAAVSASSIFAVYVLVTLIKPLIELYLPPSHPLHDWALRLCSCLFGVLIVFSATAVMHVLVPETVYIAITQGVAAGLSAIGAYHLVNTSGPDTPPAIASTVALSPSPTPTVYVPTVQRVELTHVVAPAPPPPAEAPALIVPSTSATPAVTVQTSNGGAAAGEVPVPVAMP